MQRRLFVDAGRITCVYIAACAAIATVVSAALADQARQWLHFKFGFAAFHSSLADAAVIFEHNAPTLVELFAATALVQLAALAATTKGRRAYVTFCDLVGGQVLLLNAATVGAGIGAYGERFLAALLPHGPVEISAFAIGGGVYLRSRRGRITLRAALPAAGLAILLLALAALLEEIH
jgi:hypothetical protein